MPSTLKSSCAQSKDETEHPTPSGQKCIQFQSYAKGEKRCYALTDSPGARPDCSSPRVYELDPADALRQRKKTHEQLDDASDSKHRNTMKLWDRVLT